MSEVERLVLEKHELIRQNQQLQQLIIVMAHKLKDDKGVVRLPLTKLQSVIENTEVEMKVLKSGVNLIVRDRGT